MMHLKIVHENHLRLSRGEELTIQMLLDELNECTIELRKPINEANRKILEKHISTLNLIIKSKQMLNKYY